MAEIGRCFWPRWTPGAVSISKSTSESRWAWAKRRTFACTVSMSAIVPAGTVSMMRSTSSASSRNDGGDHRSKRSEYSRTAASPRWRMSAMIPETVAVTSGLVVPAGVGAADLSWVAMRRS